MIGIQSDLSEIKQSLRGTVTKSDLKGAMDNLVQQKDLKVLVTDIVQKLLTFVLLWWFFFSRVFINSPRLFGCQQCLYIFHTFLIIVHRHGCTTKGFKSSRH
jgi:hypothetical protein